MEEIGTPFFVNTKQPGAVEHGTAAGAHVVVVVVVVEQPTTEDAGSQVVVEVVVQTAKTLQVVLEVVVVGQPAKGEGAHVVVEVVVQMTPGLHVVLEVEDVGHGPPVGRTQVLVVVVGHGPPLGRMQVLVLGATWRGELVAIPTAINEKITTSPEISIRANEVLKTRIERRLGNILIF